MKLRHSLILPIVTLSSLSLLLSSVTAQTPSATCPMDLNYVPRIPWNSSVCHNHIPSQDYTERDPCCKAVWAVFDIALAQRLKDTSLFMLPNLPTSIACLQDFQSKLTSLSLPSDIVSRCIDPMQTVITPNMCTGIESTQDVVAKLGDVTDLSYCSRPDLTDPAACNACVNAGFRAEAELLPIARNSTHDTECSHFLLLYSAGIVNRFGLMTDGSLSCIIGLSLTRGIDSSNYPGATDGTKHIKKIIIVAVIIGITIFAVCIFFLWKCTAKCKEIKKQGKGMLLINRPRNQPIFSSGNDVGEKINVVKLQDLPLFSIQDLAIATNSFHLQNKLGDGGFGPVYKGVLQNGQKIAVKRLSRASGQGLDEFMNEVLVVSKLQHRNLVRLLGCCVEKEENLLVYEYMPNNSLDTFLFDPRNQELLDWRTRFKIIEGISRGLLYLHRDSRLKIIHRDLKASNILLDEELNPKISDFGIARIFRGNEDHANTDRVVGTYGYMPPEYAMAGKFSEKSDMFSFGVLLLEIITGRSTSFFNNDESLTLLGFVWKQWNEDNVSALIDKVTSDPSCHGDVLRCIHVGLLCVQESAEERPAISTVCSMLSREIMDLPPPKQPAFVERIIATEMATTSVDGRKTFFPSNLTVTIVEGR